MRILDPTFMGESLGTTSGDELRVVAVRGGITYPSTLQLLAWSMEWDATRPVQGHASLTAADPTGVLAPWGMGDALAPGGSRLVITWVSGTSGTEVPLGRWRIRTADPVEVWRVMSGSDGSVHRLPGGGRVTVDVDEETATIVLERLDGEVVPVGATCLGEVTRLLEDICAVTVHDDVSDRDVPTSVTYGESRMDAVEDLLTAVGATHRMTPDGSLEVVPEAGVPTGWVVAGGDGGALIRLGRTLTDQGVYNAVIAEGSTPDGEPLIGRAYHHVGPLRYGTGSDAPFGRVPMMHRTIAQTPSGVQQSAQTLMANRAAGGEVDLAVTCLTNPAVQPHDLITLVAATTAGDQPLTGRVVGMRITAASSEDGTTPAKAMSLVVRVSTQALEAVAARVRRG